MMYFDDIKFISGNSTKNCLAQQVSYCPLDQTYTIEFIRTGKMHYRANDGKKVILDGPCMFWQHHKNTYNYGACDAKGWDHHWLVMSGERVRRIIEDALMVFFPTGYTCIPNPDIFDEDFHRLLKSSLTVNLYQHLDAVALLEHMIAQVLKTAITPTENNPGTMAINKLLENIRSSPMKNYDFRILARKANMSYDYFRRRFKEVSGHSPKNYLLRTRMRLAAEKLYDPGLQIKDVALDMGFNDPAAFTKLFKSKIGVSPEDYRKSIMIQKCSF